MRTYPIKRNIEKLASLHQAIKASFQNNDPVTLDSNIKNYEDINSDANLISIKSNYFFQKGDYDSAEALIKDALEIHPFHFDLHLNLGIIYELKYQMADSYYQYIRALKFAFTDQDRELIDTYINRMNLLLEEIYQEHPQELIDILKYSGRILDEKDYREFPLDSYFASTIRSPKAVGTKDEYMTNMYRATTIADVGLQTAQAYIIESLKGKIYDSEHQIILSQASILPISTLKNDTYIDFELNNKTYSFSSNDLKYNSFQYLRFNETGTLTIDMNNPLFISEPIPIKGESDKKRLVLNIFVDGVSEVFLQENNMETLMPYTHKFFENGLYAENCYATSEWTLPSIASIYTGKYTTNHHLYHPEFNYDFADYSKMIQEHFEEAGYMTTQISGDWRVTPAHGYHKGFDRTLYQNFTGGMDCRKVVMESIEQLEAFKDQNNFLSISLSDLHHVPDEINHNLAIQTKVDISQRLNMNKKGSTTVLTPYDQNKHNKYGLELTRLDFYLNILYTYINENFNNEDIVVVLYSDHGQSFLSEDPFLLNESRRKVPLMIKGGSTPVGTSNELMATIDILPTLLHLAQLPAATEIDGQLPVIFGGDSARTFTYTEAIHPNQTYKAALTDDTHHVYFENGTAIQNDGLIDLNQYTLRLINKVTGEDETEALADRADYYEQIIWEHVQSNAKF